MSTTTKKTKGHRFEKVTYRIPFYTTKFFEPEGEKEDREVKHVKNDKTIKIPMRINAKGDDSRSNITNWEIKGISHFDNNVEEVIDTLLQLQERVVKPRAIEKVSENTKTLLQLLQLV